MAWTGRFSDFDNVSHNVQSYDQRAKYPRNDVLKNAAVTKLEDLHPGVTNPTVAGIILTKDTPKCIQSKKNPGTERYLLSFVLRDAPSYFVNVTCWGAEHGIKDIAAKFAISDIVQLTNVQVQPKTYDGYEDKFKPSTPMSFNITFSENHSNIDRYIGPDDDRFRRLQNVPIKANNDYYILEDVIAHGQSLSGEHINLLAVVKKVGPVKDITTKTGKKTKRCELKLMDETCSSFALILWESDMIDIVQSWVPLDTVLFIADVRVSYDDFRSTMVSTADSKTIFTVNPDTLEAHSLYQFAHSQMIEDEDGTAGQSDPPLESITDVYTVSQLIDMKIERTDVWKPAVYGVVFAYLSKFDVDGDTSRVLRYRCNTECSNGILNAISSTVDNTQPSVEYSVTVSWSDYTGTIEYCHLDGDVAQQLIGIKAEEFAQISFQRKTQVKWTHLLEKRKMYFKMSRSVGETGKVFLRVLSCKSVDGKELQHNLQ
ncbi:meiosis-specific with OB domain-containing protein-like isoform X2 [Mizuhopecten yessoensis]|uniref:meiosis-specific with OB domain-containing protein-like isoform X2 n=1 Tax=Mizuhopecten yessoensis TaxID=6573 RepID=UPI000B45D5E2|nr:meiosis-specific with OB domain-containing protein-like isoform X2 [Mizuhopecten yessoensis]